MPSGGETKKSDSPIAAASAVVRRLAGSAGDDMAGNLDNYITTQYNLPSDRFSRIEEAGCPNVL
jgi:hypothetical protein